MPLGANPWASASSSRAGAHRAWAHVPPGDHMLRAEKTVTSWSSPLSDLGRAAFQKWSPLEGPIRRNTTRRAPPMYPSGTPAATPFSPPPVRHESTKISSFWEIQEKTWLIRAHRCLPSMSSSRHPQGQPEEELTPYGVGGTWRPTDAKGLKQVA